SPEGERLASASHDGTVRVWDPNTGRSVLRLEHPRPVYGVAYSPGGRFLVTGCQDHMVRIWGASTGKELVKFRHGLEVWSVAFTADGKHALCVSQDKTMRMWKLPKSFVDPRGLPKTSSPGSHDKTLAKVKLPIRNPWRSGHLAVTDFREIHG